MVLSQLFVTRRAPFVSYRHSLSDVSLRVRTSPVYNPRCDRGRKEKCAPDPGTQCALCARPNHVFAAAPRQHTRHVHVSLLAGRAATPRFHPALSRPDSSPWGSSALTRTAHPAPTARRLFRRNVRGGTNHIQHIQHVSSPTDINGVETFCDRCKPVKCPNMSSWDIASSTLTALCSCDFQLTSSRD